MKTVSVIIPTYNRENRIERTLVSVLDQDYPNVEIIVVDDGSTDATESVIKRLTDRNQDIGKRIRYVRQNNAGACVARNRGMMLATGDYMMFLDSDDLLKKTYLSTQVMQIEIDNSECSICDFECINDEGGIISYFNNNRYPHDFIRAFVSPHISTVMIKSDSIVPGLQWNARLKRIQDMDFVFKYFSCISTWSYVNQPLFQYCLHGEERISDSYIKGIQYDVLRESFKSYIRNNQNFITTQPMDIYRAYRKVLLKHQVKNTLARLTPIFLKKLLKQFKFVQDFWYKR